MKTAPICVILAAIVIPSASTAHAAGCIDAKSAKNGFILARPGIESEFRPVAGGMVSVVNTYASQSPQKKFLFAGLIEVFRDSDTGRLAMIPFSDLRKLFPLKTGTKGTIEFVELSPSKQPKSTKTLTLVVKGKETFSLGDCNTMCSPSRRPSRTEPARRSTPIPRSTHPICKPPSPGATMKAPARNR